MKYLVTQSYIPSEDSNHYPWVVKSTLCNTWEEAESIVSKWMAREQETYEKDNGAQYFRYEDGNDFYLECYGAVDWWHISEIKE